MDHMSAEEVVARLGLAPHPEGGHFRETFRDPRTSIDGRSVSTAIYFLLAAGEISRWHRIDATEIWHWYAGAPLALSIAPTGAGTTVQLLGNELTGGARPQLVVPAGAWQSARSLGPWTLVGCTVAPAFIFDTFELAADDFAP